MRRFIICALILFPLALSLASGCGKKTPLVPPDEDAPQKETKTNQS